MFHRGSRQRSPPQVGVQDHAGCVDDRMERVTQRLPDLTLDGARNSGQSKVNRGRIQSRGCNLRTQAGEHGAGGVRHGRLTIAANEGSQFWAVQQLIDRWKSAVEIGFGGRRHRDHYPIRRCAKPAGKVCVVAGDSPARCKVERASRRIKVKSRGRGRPFHVTNLSHLDQTVGLLPVGAHVAEGVVYFFFGYFLVGASQHGGGFALGSFQ